MKSTTNPYWIRSTTLPIAPPTMAANAMRGMAARAMSSRNEKLKTAKMTVDNATNIHGCTRSPSASFAITKCFVN